MENLKIEQLEKIIFTNGVYKALRMAYKNPDTCGYNTPSKEWDELLDAYDLVKEKIK
jgi:hypothetical protein